MALIKCMECGHDVSDKASACPNCGCPLTEMVAQQATEPEKEQIDYYQMGYDLVQENLKREEEEYVADMEQAVKKGKAVKASLFGNTYYIEKWVALRTKKDDEIFREMAETSNKIAMEISGIIEHYGERIQKEYTADRIKSYEKYQVYIEEIIEGFLKDITQKVNSIFKQTKHLSHYTTNGFMDHVKQEYYQEAQEGNLELVNLNASLEKIVQQLVDQMEYEQMIGNVKKELRGRAVGGGTTIGSALMGMAAAGVANAAYGGLYEMKNILSNAKAATKRRDQFMNALLGNDFKNALIQAVKHDITIFLVIIRETIKTSADVINDQYDGKLPDYQEVRKGFQSDTGKYGKEKDYTIEDLKSDFVFYLTEFPTEDYLYISFLEQFGDEAGELDALAEVGQVDINQIRKNIFIKREKSISSALYGAEYVQKLEECAKQLGYKAEIGEHVTKRNASVLEKACSENNETIEGLERNIKNLREIDLPEAQEKIREFEEKIDYIKDRDDISKYLSDVNADSMLSLFSAYKNVKKINTDEAEIKALELVKQIAELSLAKKTYEDKLFFADGIDKKLIEKISTEKQTIEDSFHELQDCWEREQYDAALKKMEGIDFSVYDVQENIKLLWNNKMEISRVLAPRNEKKRELEKEMHSLEEQIDSKQREYDSSDAVSENALVGLFVNKQRQENLDRISREKRELQERYEEIKKEYEINIDLEETKKYLQNRLSNMELPQPIFRYKETEKVIPFSMPKVIYYNQARISMLEVTKPQSLATDSKYVYKTTSRLAEQYGKLIACDGDKIYSIVYNKYLYDLGEKLKEIFGMESYRENVYLLFEGLGKEHYEEEMERQEQQKKRLEEERRKQEEQRREEQKKAELLNRKVKDIFAGDGWIVALYDNGTTSMHKEFVDRRITGSCKEVVESLQDVESISICSTHIVALKKNGTVVAAGNNKYGQCDVSGWRNMKMIDTNFGYTLGLQTNGKVKIAGNYLRQNSWCDGNVDLWRDIIKIYAGESFAFGIDSSGKVHKIGSDLNENFPVEKWNNIIDVVELNGNAVIGLQKNGAINAFLWDYHGSTVQQFQSWNGVKKIVSANGRIMALREDGRVLIPARGSQWLEPIREWRNIMDIAMDNVHCVGLKADGTVVIASHPEFSGKSHMSWKNVKKIATCPSCTIALTADGTILEADNGFKD